MLVSTSGCSLRRLFPAATQSRQAAQTVALCDIAPTSAPRASNVAFSANCGLTDGRGLMLFSATP